MGRREGELEAAARVGEAPCSPQRARGAEGEHLVAAFGFVHEDSSATRAVKAASRRWRLGDVLARCDNVWCDVPTDLSRGEPVAESRLECLTLALCSVAKSLYAPDTATVESPAATRLGAWPPLHAPACTAAKRQAPATCKRNASSDLARD